MAAVRNLSTIFDFPKSDWRNRFCSLGSRNHFYSQANKICSTRSVILRNSHLHNNRSYGCFERTIKWRSAFMLIFLSSPFSINLLSFAMSFSLLLIGFSKSFPCISSQVEGLVSVYNSDDGCANTALLRCRNYYVIFQSDLHADLVLSTN